MHPFPCLHCHPRTYIRMVQNLIERCLLLCMDREQCVKALAERAGIHPRVTRTVWKELVKENKDFFLSYFRIHIFKGHLDLQEETTIMSKMNEPGQENEDFIYV